MVASRWPYRLPPGGLDRGLNLAGGEVLPGPKVGVLLPLRDDCSYYFSWRHPLPSPCQAIRGISGIPLTPELRTRADVRLVGLWGSTKPHNEPHAIPA
jgi:hypothetical protein